jgi:hypothetical protein
MLSVPAVVPTFVKIDAGAAALSVARGSRNLRDTAGAVTAVGAVAGQHWAPLAGMFFLTGLAGERLLVPAMEWLGNDPPDRDYGLAVRLKRSHLHPTRKFDVEDGMVQHALQGFRSIDFAAAALRAMLRAAEREQAADLAGDAEAAELRAQEGTHFRMQTIDGLHAAAQSYRTLADDQEELASSRDFDRSQIKSRRLLRDVRGLLIESGVPERLAVIRVPGKEWRGFSESIHSLVEASDACQSLAAALGQW